MVVSVLSPKKRDALVAYLLEKPLSEGDKKELSGGKERLTTPYLMNGYRRFITKEGYPGINPPWGTLNAIDLNTGQMVWQSVLGEFPELKAKGIPLTGREGYGGQVVTKGGGCCLLRLQKTKCSEHLTRKRASNSGKQNYPPAAMPCLRFINGK